MPAVIGCSKPKPTPVNTRDIYLRLDGQKCYFPFQFTLDGKQWKRSDEGPKKGHEQLRCGYRSSTDEWVQLGYLTREEKAYWFIEECEQDRRGNLRWKKNHRRLMSTDRGLVVAHYSEQDPMHGPMKFFYCNGQLKLDGYANLTVLYGPASGYYEDGTRCWIGNFTSGSIIPQETRCFDRNGQELTDLTVNEVIEHYDQWVALHAPGEDVPFKVLLKRLTL